MGKIEVSRRRENNAVSHLPAYLTLISRVFHFFVSILGHLKHLVSKFFRGIKKTASIAIVVAVVVLTGHVVSAQTAPPPLNQVRVPKPTNIAEFVKDESAAIALGKSLFWDMQLGSDGIQSCASCHFKAGADNRSKNVVNPGSDNVFNVGGKPNYQLAAADFPFHKLSDPNNSASNVLSSVNDAAGSQGVTRADFVDTVPGSDKDITTPKKDAVFNVNGTNVRRVTPRNTPTVINAVFNFRNFWDGSASNIFNGVNALGPRDPNAFVLKATGLRRLQDVKVRIDNSSLASQAVRPPLSAFETAAENDDVIAPFRIELTSNDANIQVFDAQNRSVGTTPADQGISVDGGVAPQVETAPAPATETTPQVETAPAPATETQPDLTKQDKQSKRNIAQVQPGGDAKPKFRRFGRKLGKKLRVAKPLAKQVVAADDSVLAALRDTKGLKGTYEQLIQNAFKPEWWDSNIIIRINPKTGRRTFVRKPRRPLRTNEYTLMEYNFSLFFGLAVQSYESTLVSDQTPFDQFLGGNTNALTPEQQRGFQLFQQNACIGCHSGSELTTASVSSVERFRRVRRLSLPQPLTNRTVQDTGFFGIGVRLKAEDKGVGGLDELGNSLSETQLIKDGKFEQLIGEPIPTITPPIGLSSDILITEGAFKTPGLRNVELTAPYFHNGGQLTLEQVVDFYVRGGDFRNDATLALPVLNLTAEQRQDLVAFLKGLTDERVRFQRAPFDHPSLLVPNGHTGNQNSVTVDTSITSDGTTVAKDDLLEIPAVGRGGSSTPLPNFLATAS
jgi:cytochrome c peroxidase